MLNKKIKKRLLNLFALLQIGLLILGNASPASAVWTSLRNETSKNLPSGVKDESEYNVVSSYKKNDMTPKVTVMFAPTNPKPGDKVTATAVASAFANDESQLYYTWFLQRKGCEVEVEGSDDPEYGVPSEEYDPDDEDEYKKRTLPAKPEDGAYLSPAECDVDGDKMITSNDWRIEAMRKVAQNGFEPDTGLNSKYKDLDDFYSEDIDSDSYQVWQGGADAERMPSHCYSYDGTSGIMFEHLDKNVNGAPICPDGQPAVCGLTVNAELATNSEDPCVCGPDDVDNDGYLDIDHCNSCVDGYINSTRVNNSNLWPVPSTRNEPPDTFWPVPASSTPDGIVQWWECEIDKNYCDPNGSTYDSSGNVVGDAHMDCAKNETYEACQKLSESPYCGAISSGAKKGQYAALCGEDSDGDGLDDNAGDVSPGVAVCPTNGIYQIGNDPFGISQPEFNSAITGGLTYLDDEYIFGRNGKYDPLTELPACNCYKTGTMESPKREEGIPYTGGTDKKHETDTQSDDPLCKDPTPTEDDLLCGNDSGPVALGHKNQFHLFPRMLSNNNNYYETSRDYFDNDDNSKFSYELGNTTGDNKFDMAEERFWGTDPRNPSTAGNSKPDEANVAGVGATEFSWEYQVGDKVGVAVEGTSNIGTKFPDSSRMIMWAFSKSENKTTGEDDAEAACQPRYGGTYKITDFSNMQRVPTPVGAISLPTTLEMPTGFLDFEHCLEKSLIPVIPGAGVNGSQPKPMEVEISVTPTEPVNDESGEGRGDIVDVQAIVSGSVNPSNDLNYSWKIERFKPDPGKIPNDRDWESAEVETICDDDSASCLLKNGEGGKIKMKGIGLSGINFGLNIAAGPGLHADLFNENGEGYLRISVEVRENDSASSSPNSRVGKGEAAVKVTSAQNQIMIFKPAINGLSIKVPNPLTEADQICYDPKKPEERLVCPVTKNEIIGVKTDVNAGPNGGKPENLENFDWFSNGRTLVECDSNMSNDCGGGNVTFFPVTGNVGDTFTIGVRANNIAGKREPGEEEQTGKKIELVRKFKVVEPSVKIVPDGDGAKAKLLGSAIDPTTNEVESNDYSESVLEATAGDSVELTLDYEPDYIGDSIPDSEEKWMVDGNPATAPIKFTAGPVGTVHNVSAGVSYKQSTATYGILKKAFSISPTEMTAQNIGHSIQVEVNQESGVAQGLKGTGKIMANLLSRVPQQVLFFLRLILSMALVLVLTGTIFSFFPQTAYREKREWQ